MRFILYRKWEYAHLHCSELGKCGISSRAYASTRFCNHAFRGPTGTRISTVWGAWGFYCYKSSIECYCYGTIVLQCLITLGTRAQNP